MSRFMENAARIFEAAESAADAGSTLSNLTILINTGGGIRLVADCDWPLDSLQAERGAGMVYRVSQRAQTVRVEGRAGSRTCLFETETTKGVAQCLLAGTPLYFVEPPQSTPALLPAGTSQLPPAVWG
ncbi:MAG: hypothetical protein HUU41_03825 [Bryobacteraceae bacterium]|nr:hypothetical protein [Bryobacteraceae bacterium]